MVSIRHMRLRTEVPIRFLQVREGRLPPPQALRWFSPWQAAWINLRAMFVYGADFFLFMPGCCCCARPAADAAARAGRVTVGPITFSLHWMLLGLSLAIVGLQSIYWASCRRSSSTIRGSDGQLVPALPVDPCRGRRRALFAVGLVLGGPADRDYIRNGSGCPRRVNHQGVIGSCSSIRGFMTSRSRCCCTRTAVAGEAARMSDTRSGSVSAGRARPPVDRFGVWLSARQIRRHVPTFDGKRIGDVGCGFQRRSRARSSAVRAAVLVDVALAPMTQGDARVSAVEGTCRTRSRRCRRQPGRAADACRCSSTSPTPWSCSPSALVLGPGGIAWSTSRPGAGRRYLELSAFRLGLSPAARWTTTRCTTTCATCGRCW